jgi:hypothetical protein
MTAPRERVGCLLSPVARIGYATAARSGYVGLSSLVCLRVDHICTASLVWVMLLAAAALVITFTLAYRSRTLAPLVAWIRQ